MKKFIFTTIIGGILFLVPLVVVVMIFSKAFEIMTMVAKPIDKLIPFDAVAGVGVINILAVLVMLLVCLIAGLIARGTLAKALYTRIDSVLLEIIPGYAWTKTVMGSFGGQSDVDNFKPVLVRLDDQMQVGFELERSANGLVVVFFPGAPDVRSGAVAYLTPDRVQSIDANFLAINKSLKHMGKGAADLLPPDL